MAPRKAPAAADQASADPKPTTTARRRGQRQPTRPPQEQAQHAQARQRLKQRAAQRQVEHREAEAQQQVEAQAKMAQLPIVHEHAAGIDVGDTSHWVCVEQTPDGSDTVREFPAHTPGLRQLVAWLQECGVTTIALEASGVYGHVLFLTLIEEGFPVILTAPQFARQIKGRPKTDKRDCQWIQRLHKLGFLPSVFQPDEATQTLRDYVRQRANHVRLSGQHIQRMQKALELMNLKLTNVLGDVTGVTGLKIIRAIVQGERDPHVLAKLRDRRCQRSAAEIGQALDGRYRPEHVLELKLCLTMWEQYQRVIGQLDTAIDQHLRKLQARTHLPPLPPRPRVRGRKPHDPGFDVRTALYYVIGVDLTAIEGIDEIHALTLVSELGTDFSKWPTVKHFASWLGLCPNWKKTGGKVKSSKTRKGKNRAASALRLAAWSLMRSKSYLGAYLRRQRSRLGAPKAITATAHKLARILYNLMRYGVEYMKKTEAEYAEQVQARVEKSLQRRARELGYELKKIAAEPADTGSPPAAEPAYVSG
ncbi:MAG: IS110 family transposase [Gemmataceae bacterium]|nr:IS110 family transposase [Gemmataceae bacterium]